MANNAIVTCVEIFSLNWHDRWGGEGSYLSLTEEGALTQAVQEVITLCRDRREDAFDAACAAYLGLKVEDGHYSEDDLDAIAKLTATPKTIKDKKHFLTMLDEYGATEDVITLGNVSKAIVTED